MPEDPPRSVTDTAIATGVAFLESAQLAWGEWKVAICDDAALTIGCETPSSPFGTTFILYALTHISDPASARMQTKALAFLQQEMEPGGWWPFWGDRAGMPIAGDVDTTVTAAFALARSGSLLDNRALLMSNRTTDTALFLTWFPDYPYGNDVDCVVNANALLYLGDEELTEVCAYVNQSIATAAQCSTYYPDELDLAYAASRALREGSGCLQDSAGVLAERAWLRLADVNLTALEAALAINVLWNLGTPPAELSDAAGRLMDMQAADGSWPAEPYWCIDCTRQVIEYFGSAELTTGFALEALAKLSPHP